MTMQKLIKLFKHNCKHYEHVIAHKFNWKVNTVDLTMECKKCKKTRAEIHYLS